ncbi:MAG: transglycosylase domain-containing protein [Actinomycetota bacterium]
MEATITFVPVKARSHEGLSRSALAFIIAFGVAVAAVAAVAAVGATAVTRAFHAAITADTDVTAAPEVQSSMVLDRNGKLIAYLHGDQNRILIPRSDMPKSMRNAVVAIEDSGFYDHHGISMRAIFRSIVHNARHDDLLQGGSTITQQYVRNAYPSVGKERTIARKIREAKVALKVEREMNKEQILDAYLNTVYFGRGAYGLEAAAKAYFWKPAKKLLLWEAAYLAGIIQSPEHYDFHPKAALQRRNQVLDRMLQLGMISKPDHDRSVKHALGVRKIKPEPVRAAYFVEYVRRLLVAPVSEGGFGLTDAQVYGGGLVIHTTLDLNMQDYAENAIQQVLNQPNDPEVGFVATTTSGEVRAMVGGRNFTSLARARGFNYAAQVAPGMGRSPGSTFKPFTLTAYLEHGFSPRRTFQGPARITIPQCGNGRQPWSPTNYSNEHFGALSVIEATEKSVNTVYAQMVAATGPANVVDAAHRAGITSPLKPVCSITLGVFGVSPLEMARAYSTFATGGLRPDIIAVTEITGPGGRIVADRRPTFVRTIREDIANAVANILEKVVQVGTGTPAAIDRPSAGKTGTTEDHKDVWYAGFTPHPGLTAVVWIGYPPGPDGKIPDMQTLHGRTTTGGYFGGSIWKYFMQQATVGMPVLTFADGHLDSINSGDTSNIGVAVLPSPSPSTVNIPGIGQVPVPGNVPKGPPVVAIPITKR